jgi:hypothetical protein
MPHRTGLSHAVFAVLLSVLWVAFYRSLEVVVSEERFVAMIEIIAGMIHEYTGVSVAYGTVVTMVAIATVTVLGFAWGYTFHRRTFGKEP